jgi:hypothetical protein
MQSAKKHIREIVEDYTKLFPEEFEEFKQGMPAIRASLQDEEFGQMLPGTSSGSRALYELPETLHTMFVMKLEEDEMLWLKTGDPVNRNAGGQWFAKTFREFTIPNKI